jgi:hypothetical protein
LTVIIKVFRVYQGRGVKMGAADGAERLGKEQWLLGFDFKNT